MKPVDLGLMGIVFMFSGIGWLMVCIAFSLSSNIAWISVLLVIIGAVQILVGMWLES